MLNVEDIPDFEWQQVYAVCNLDGEVPVVLYDDSHANLPGGKTEPGEATEQTLFRELKEEINCRVLEWRPIGYQKLTEPGVADPIYQLRVYAIVEKIGDFQEDVGGEVMGYKLIKIQDLNHEIGFGAVGARIQAHLEDQYAPQRKG